MKTSAIDARVVDALRDADPHTRESAARICGDARWEATVPLLSRRLLDPDPEVRVAATAALGAIGGARSADALLRALRTGRVPRATAVTELARSAPDHYLETALGQPENTAVRGALAQALELRRPPAFPERGRRQRRSARLASRLARLFGRRVREARA